MGEFTFKLTKQPDFGDREYIIDVGPTWVEGFVDPAETDPDSIINGGVSVPPVRKPEGRR